MTFSAFALVMFLATISSLVLYFRTASDIFGLLAIVGAIACLLWGLVVAHWFVHLLALMALLILRKPKIIDRVAATLE